MHTQPTLCMTLLCVCSQAPPVKASLSPYSPLLPYNIIQLGDPNLRVMNIPTAPQEQDYNLPTLSPETLGDIWQRHLIPHS